MSILRCLSVTLELHISTEMFSLKEAIYKATHPFICEHVGFRQAEVTPHPDGTATCVWYLPSGAHKRLGATTAHWRKLDCGEYFLTSASAKLKDDEEHCLLF
jgi:4'-phosphopantetheinyl transferase EntD